MRILYTHRTRGRGAEGVHVMGMVDAFREDGHLVLLDGPGGCDPYEINGLAAPRATARSWTAFGQHFVAEHTPQFVFGLVELAYNLPVLWRLWRQVRAFRPDVVYERYAVGHGAPALLCHLLDIPRIAEVNDSVVIERSRPLSLTRVKRFIEGRSLRSAARVVTISQEFKRRLIDAYAVAEDDILVCPNAVSAQRFVAPAASRLDALRRQWGLEGRVVLGSAGQFVAWHGLAPFVTAMAELVREHRAVLFFIGDGPVREDVLNAARAAGVLENVIFTGMMPHALIPEHLALLDVAVIPFSNMHGSPMKLMEFMAMGLPVIAPDLPPIREVIKDGRTGRIFRRNDMEDMRRILTEMLAEPEGMQRLGRDAKNYVLANLTWRAHAKKCIEALG